jgi:insertion element IS1 protein InsB
MNTPHCSSDEVSKNGEKPNGRQNFLCKHCGKQFQQDYQYKGSDPATKSLIQIMLLRNCGVRDIETILGVSRYSVLSCLRRSALLFKNRPQHSYYPSLQIDEFWTYVGKRKEGKVWLLYAYSPEFDEIVAYVTGNRSAKTVEKLYKELSIVEVGEFCTDEWRAFQKVLPTEKHRIGKENTKHIEGVNTSFRTRNRRLVRQTTCFSKSMKNHLLAINLMISSRNQTHHTF